MTMKVGITGHQRLNDSKTWGWIRTVLINQLDTIHQSVKALSSLAIGADQLFASLVADRGGQIYAIIPFTDYEHTFKTKKNLSAYHMLLGKATSVEILHTSGNDQEKFYAAGKRMVDLADLVIAVWRSGPHSLDRKSGMLSEIFCAIFPLSERSRR